MPPKRIIKFLALHGHAMNPQVFEKKIGAIRSEIKKLGVEFVFAQGPIIPDHDWMNPNSKEEADSTLKSEETTSATVDNASASAAASSPVTQQQQQGESSPAATTVYSWADFWSWKRNKLPKPVYYGLADTIKTFAEITKSQGPFDGIFAFSQGTGAAALWLALEAQELRRSVELAENGKSDDEGDVMNVDDSLSLSEWRIPKSLRLLSTTDPTTAVPFLLVNVSGVVQKDDVFGNFIHSQLSSLPDTERRLAAFLTKNAAQEQLHSTLSPLRPFHVLNVYGENDAVVEPKLTRIMTELYRSVCNAKGPLKGDEAAPAAASEAATKLAYGGVSGEWSHDGGHVVPAALRKPLKALVEQIYGNGK